MGYYDPPEPGEPAPKYSGNAHDRRKARRKAEYVRCRHGKMVHKDGDGCGKCIDEMSAWQSEGQGDPTDQPIVTRECMEEIGSPAHEVDQTNLY